MKTLLGFLLVVCCLALKSAQHGTLSASRVDVDRIGQVQAQDQTQKHQLSAKQRQTQMAGVQALSKLLDSGCCRLCPNVFYAIPRYIKPPVEKSAPAPQPSKAARFAQIFERSDVYFGNSIFLETALELTAKSSARTLIRKSGAKPPPTEGSTGIPITDPGVFSDLPCCSICPEEGIEMLRLADMIDFGEDPRIHRPPRSLLISQVPCCRLCPKCSNAKKEAARLAAEQQLEAQGGGGDSASADTGASAGGDGAGAAEGNASGGGGEGDATSPEQQQAFVQLFSEALSTEAELAGLGAVSPQRLDRLRLRDQNTARRLTRLFALQQHLQLAPPPSSSPVSLLATQQQQHAAAASTTASTSKTQQQQQQSLQLSQQQEAALSVYLSRALDSLIDENKPLFGLMGELVVFGYDVVKRAKQLQPQPSQPGMIELNQQQQQEQPQLSEEQLRQQDVKDTKMLATLTAVSELLEHEHEEENSDLPAVEFSATKNEYEVMSRLKRLATSKKKDSRVSQQLNSFAAAWQQQLDADAAKADLALAEQAAEQRRQRGPPRPLSLLQLDATENGYETLDSDNADEDVADESEEEEEDGESMEDWDAEAKAVLASENAYRDDEEEEEEEGDKTNNNNNSDNSNNNNSNKPPSLVQTKATTGKVGLRKAQQAVNSFAGQARSQAKQMLNKACKFGQILGAEVCAPLAAASATTAATSKQTQPNNQPNNNNNKDNDRNNKNNNNLNHAPAFVEASHSTTTTSSSTSSSSSTTTNTATTDAAILAQLHLPKGIEPKSFFRKTLRTLVQTTLSGLRHVKHSIGLPTILGISEDLTQKATTVTTKRLKRHLDPAVLSLASEVQSNGNEIINDVLEKARARLDASTVSFFLENAFKRMVKEAIVALGYELPDDIAEASELPPPKDLHIVKKLMAPIPQPVFRDRANAPTTIDPPGTRRSRKEICSANRLATCCQVCLTKPFVYDFRSYQA